MMTLALATILALQDEPPKDIYEEISKRNSFSPRIEKPKPKDDGAVAGPPPPPPQRPFRLNGLWWDPIDKAYVAYMTDVEFDDGKILKAGDTHYGAKVDGVTKDGVSMTVEGNPQTLEVGGEFRMVAERGSRPAAAKPAETKPAESAPVAAETKPAEKKPSNGKGLLDWFRTRKKPD